MYFFLTVHWGTILALTEWGSRSGDSTGLHYKLKTEPRNVWSSVSWTVLLQQLYGLWNQPSGQDQHFLEKSMHPHIGWASQETLSSNIHTEVYALAYNTTFLYYALNKIFKSNRLRGQGLLNRLCGKYQLGFLLGKLPAQLMKQF